MQIQLLTHYYPPEIGAASKRLSSLVSAWVSEGDEVSVVTPLPHYPEGRILAGWSFGRLGSDAGPFGERITRVPCVPSTGGGMWKLLDQLVAAGATVVPALTRGRPDVVVASVPGMPTMVPALMSGWRWHVPVVLDMRDSWPDLITEANLLPGPAGLAAQRVVFAAQRRAAAITIVPSGFRASLVRNGVSDCRVHDLPNGINVEAVPIQPPLGKRGRLRVLYLGTLGVSQALDIVLKALARSRDHVEARFIGGGTEGPRLEALAREINAPVTFEPSIEAKDVWGAYEWADTCLVPLRDWPSFRDAVPSKLYEIMATGRHITAIISGAGEAIIRDSGAGVTTHPGDVSSLARTFEHLATNRDLLNVGGRPRQWVAENRDQAVLAKRFRDVLVDVVNMKAERRLRRAF